MQLLRVIQPSSAEITTDVVARADYVAYLLNAKTFAKQMILRTARVDSCPGAILAPTQFPTLRSASAHSGQVCFVVVGRCKRQLLSIYYSCYSYNYNVTTSGHYSSGLKSYCSFFTGKIQRYINSTSRKYLRTFACTNLANIQR